MGGLTESPLRYQKFSGELVSSLQETRPRHRTCHVMSLSKISVDFQVFANAVGGSTQHERDMIVPCSRPEQAMRER